MELSHTSSKSHVPQPTATSWLGNLSIHPARGRKENHCSRRRNVVSPGLCPRLPVCFIDKPVSKAKETLSWLVGESDQGNCCCPSCNERRVSHRLVARGRSRSTCSYFFYLLLLVMSSFTSTCNRLACLSWLTCSTSSSLMIPIVSFLLHLFPFH